MAKRIQNLRIDKVSLVRKGYRPVNDGARIKLVKATEGVMEVQEQQEQQVGGERVVKGKGGPNNSPMSGPANGATPPMPAANVNIPASMPAASASVPKSGRAKSKNSKGKAKGKVAFQAMFKAAAEQDEDAFGAATEEYIDARIKKAVKERVAKAVAEIGQALAVAAQDEVKKATAASIEAARQPLTPGVSAAIRPEVQARDPKAIRKSLEGMSLGEAVTYLMNLNENN